MIAAGPRRERGIAVLTAMLVVALATILAVNLLWETGVDLQRTETLLGQDQARQIDMGFESVAIQVLAEINRDSGSAATVSAKDLAGINGLPPQSVLGGSARIHVEDAQGKFNLNDLIDQTGHPSKTTKKVEQFQRLLQLLPLRERPPLSASEAQMLTDAVVDWIDPEDDAELNGAEESTYTGGQPPYRPANFWFTSVSELLAVRTTNPDLYFNQEIFQQLQPYVAALPPGREAPPYEINVNTAAPLLLASLAPNLTAQDLPLAPAGGYSSADEFLQEATLQGKVDVPLAVTSKWFLLTVNTSIGTTQATMYSLLERSEETVRTRLRTFDAQ